MRVVTANLQHGVPDPIARPALGRAVAPLRALAADVYAFQELDRGRWRTRFAHQGADLAAALAGELVWARAKGWLWVGQANALVVRGEVSEQQVLPLPGPGERRVAMLATAVVAGERWSLACAHLALRPAVAHRQLHRVLEELWERPAPRVLLGDLNLRPERVGPAAAAVGFHLLEGPETINARAATGSPARSRPRARCHLRGEWCAQAAGERSPRRLGGPERWRRPYDGLVIEAAGGVVQRRGADGATLVLVVHRPRYDDWTLPKGKLDAGESHLEAALREVHEETGLRCRAHAELRPVRYQDREGRPKRVRYWVMEPLSGHFTVNSEVDEVRWVPVDEATGLLTYERDAEVLAEL